MRRFAERIKALHDYPGQLQGQIDNSFSKWVREYTKEKTGNDSHPQMGASMSTRNWSEPRGFFTGSFRTQEAIKKWRQWAIEHGHEFPPDIKAQPPEEIARESAKLRRFFGNVEQQRIEYAERVWREAWEPVEAEMRRTHAMAVWLSLLSPAGAYRVATAVLARTEREDYWRFLQQGRQHRKALVAHYEQEGWFEKREWFDQDSTEDLSGLPVFREREVPFLEDIAHAGPAIMILGAFCLVLFMGSYWRFRRYDLTA